jgi:hypothetical protein
MLLYAASFYLLGTTSYLLRGCTAIPETEDAAQEDTVTDRHETQNYLRQQPVVALTKG